MCHGLFEGMHVPLAIHHHEGLRREFSLWAGSDMDAFGVSATCNVLNDSPVPLVISGAGCVATTDDHLDGGESAGVRFLPFDPPLETRCVLLHYRPSKRFTAGRKVPA